MGSVNATPSGREDEEPNTSAVDEPAPVPVSHAVEEASLLDAFTALDLLDLLPPSADTALEGASTGVSPQPDAVAIAVAATIEVLYIATSLRCVVPVPGATACSAVFYQQTPKGH